MVFADMSPSIQWLKLIKFVQAHPFSELTIVFKNGEPVIIEQCINKVKLD